MNIRIALAALALLVSGPALAQTQQIKQEFDAAKAALDAGNYNQAAAQFSGLIDGGQAKDVWLAYSHFYRGVALRRTNQESKALPDFRKTIELAPDLAPAYIQIGLILHERKDYADAIKQFNQALKIEPNNPEFLYLRCVSRSWSNDNKGAREDCGKAAELRPDYVEALAGLGRAHEDLGERAKAIEVYNRVLKLDPNNKQAQEGIKFLQETAG